MVGGLVVTVGVADRTGFYWGELFFGTVVTFTIIVCSAGSGEGEGVSLGGGGEGLI